MKKSPPRGVHKGLTGSFAAVGKRKEEHFILTPP
jgi:hypothetical protein